MKYSNSFRAMDIIFGLLSTFGIIASCYLSIDLFSKGVISLGQMSLVFAFVLTFFPKLVWLTYDVREMAKNMTDHSPYGSVMQDIKIIPGSLKGMRIK